MRSSEDDRGGHARIIAMFQAYFDESGIQDSAPVCLVCGYFGGPGQWQFGNEWKDVLDEYGINEFHAKQFGAFDPFGKRVGSYWQVGEYMACTTLNGNGYRSPEHSTRPQNILSQAFRWTVRLTTLLSLTDR